MAVIVDDFVLTGLNATDNEEDALAIRRVRSLLSRTIRTLPGSRGLGMDDQYLDYPPQTAKNMFAIDLYEKVNKFIPDVDIEDIEWVELEEMPGRYKIHIKLERNED